MTTHETPSAEKALLQRKLKMVEAYQCPGCVCGEDTKCGRFMLEDRAGGFWCANHVLGTFMMGVGSFALGLPKGFCRAGFEMGGEHRNRMSIRLFLKGSKPQWNQFNVPVWAMARYGHLFVRTFAPRVNSTFVDVVEDGSRAELCPQALDVGEFIGEID